MKKFFRKYTGKKSATGNQPGPATHPPVENVPNTSTTQASSIQSGTARALPSGDVSNCLGDGDRLSLWDQAYDALKRDSPDKVEEYEILLSTELPATNTPLKGPDPEDATENLINADPKTRQSQFSKISEQGLTRMDGKKLEYTIAGHQFVLRDQITQAVNIVQGVKTLIDKAVQASPEASMAWAGVCIILPLLANPKTADEANRGGFSYVTTRMNYYIALEPMLNRLYRGADVPGDLVKAHVKGLYQGILDFQIRSVLRFYRSSFKNLSRDVIRHDDWEGMLKKVKESEEVVKNDISQVNDLKSTQELEDLNTTANEHFRVMGQFLSVAEQQLKVASDHRDISQEGLQIQKDMRDRALSEKENACLQLFRLTRADKDVTYDWYKNRTVDRVEGTCEWFLGHRNFESWTQQDSGLLAVSADPGCGKSVLAKHLIDHKLPPSATICYFFFKDQDQDTVRQALCALLHQLFCQKPSLIHHAMEEYRTNGEGLINATQKLWSVLNKATRDPQTGPVTIVLDALDECRESELQPLIDGLDAHISGDNQVESKVKYLVTTRPYDQIMSQLQRLMGTSSTVHIPGDENSDAISEEVNHVIRERVKNLADMIHLNSQTADHLAQKLLEMKHRTYLWVYLIFDDLTKLQFKKTPKGVDQAIGNLPKNVDEAYEKILSKSQNTDMVRKVLSIILAASRPLTVTEMNAAVNTDRSMSSMTDLDLEEDSDFETRIKSLCGLFVTTYNGQVYFLHQTAREFLRNQPSSGLVSSQLNADLALPKPSWKHSITAQEAHAALAEACVVYLRLLNHEEISSRNSTPIIRHRRYPFIEYSAEEWGGHFREASISDDILIAYALEICRHDSTSYSLWTPLCLFSGFPFDSKPSLLTLASFYGLVGVVKRLLDTNKDEVDLTNTDGDTALHWAADSGYEAVVRILLETGQFDVNCKNKHGQTPLSFAVEDGSVTVVKLLLDTGNVDVDSSMPLFTAARYGNEGIVKLLVDKGADVNAKTSRDQTPLFPAVRWGHTAIVKLLLETGKVDVDLRDKQKQTPLSLATKHRHEAIKKMLLAYKERGGSS
ncbi:hypothetical protein AK830_g8228 [Neonectria ditissima]|uniref:Uncharacterized protein n=1 Tax=Neonectria ditissima TaxID=78410 RepID=A0A0P7B8I6_9HYPO|nr:hypothetical protein AK830_g8228 [Neonectria ditissima]